MVRKLFPGEDDRVSADKKQQPGDDQSYFRTEPKRK